MTRKRKAPKPVAPDRTTEYYPLSFKEFCTVLAALRVFQRIRAAGGHLPQGDPNVYTQEQSIERMEHFEDATPLSDEEIDSLCERINYSDKSRNWPKYVQAAKRLYQVDGEIEVDQCALVSEGDEDGSYVQAWVWVPRAETKGKR